MRNNYATKMTRKLEAHKRGKRTRVTYPNPKTNETNRQFITVSGNDYWGDPRATKKKD